MIVILWFLLIIQLNIVIYVFVVDWVKINVNRIFKSIGNIFDCSFKSIIDVRNIWKFYSCLLGSYLSVIEDVKKSNKWSRSVRLYIYRCQLFNLYKQLSHQILFNPIANISTYRLSQIFDGESSELLKCRFYVLLIWIVFVKSRFFGANICSLRWLPPFLSQNFRIFHLFVLLYICF
jgi:hypothetical protein